MTVGQNSRSQIEAKDLRIDLAKLPKVGVLGVLEQINSAEYSSPDKDQE